MVVHDIPICNRTKIWVNVARSKYPVSTGERGNWGQHPRNGLTTEIGRGWHGGCGHCVDLELVEFLQLLGFGQLGLLDLDFWEFSSVCRSCHALLVLLYLWIVVILARILGEFLANFFNEVGFLLLGLRLSTFGELYIAHLSEAPHEALVAVLNGVFCSVSHTFGNGGPLLSKLQDVLH